MSGGDFENYKFIMIPEDGGGHRSRDRHGDRRGSRQEYHASKYPSDSKYRSGSPTYGGNPHVYRGGARQYPKPSHSSYPSSSSSAAPYPSHRGAYDGGRYPTRSRGFAPRSRGFAPRSRGFAPRGAFRGGPPMRGRGSYRGSSYRSDGTPPPPTIGRKPRVHPLPYAVSPVRADESADSGAVETLTKGELLERMRDAKESDNFDELYRLREYYRELKSRGLPNIRVPSQSTSSKNHHGGDDSSTEPADWDLEEIECIEETFDDDDEQDQAEQTMENEVEQQKGASSRKRTAERAVGSSSSSRSTPRKRSPGDRHKESRRSERSSNGERNGSDRKEAAVAGRAEDRNGRDKSSGDADGRQPVARVVVSMSSKRRRRCDDSSYGEEEDDEVEDLQFAEDSVDVEAMVKASKAGSRLDESAEDETADFMAALIGDEEDGDGADYELDYEEVASGIGEVTPTLSALLTDEANRQLAAVSAERRGRLYRRLLARHQTRPARVREDVDVAYFRRFVPALVRALAAELPPFLVQTAAGSQAIVAKTDVELRVASVLTALDARPADHVCSVDEEPEERSEWALDDDQPAGGSSGEEPMTVDRRVATAVALILRHLRPTTSTTSENVAEMSSARRVDV